MLSISRPFHVTPSVDPIAGTIENADLARGMSPEELSNTLEACRSLRVSPEELATIALLHFVDTIQSDEAEGRRMLAEIVERFDPTIKLVA